jgi:ferredoxin
MRTHCRHATVWMGCQGDGHRTHDAPHARHDSRGGCWRCEACVGCPTRCPTDARPIARLEHSHSLGLPDLSDLSWNRETSSSFSEGRRWGSNATASFASSRKTGRAGRAALENGCVQVGQQVGHCPTCPVGSVGIAFQQPPLTTRQHMLPASITASVHDQCGRRRTRTTDPMPEQSADCS